MGTGTLPEFPHTLGGSSAKQSAPHGNGHVGLTPGTRTRGAIPGNRMRLLHYENAFGDVYASEYCLDAMISLTLFMAKSARPDTDRLARLTGAAAAAPPAEAHTSASAVG